MASSTRTVRVRFDGDIDGLRAASAAAEAQMTGFQQKMGLIAVAVLAATTVAVPALLTGATALFAGIAAIGLFQSERIKNTFADMGQVITANLAEDSRTLGATAVHVSQLVGFAFEKIRPILRDTFASIGPQVLDLTAGILGLVTNALPGLSRAAKESGNAIKGVRDFLESTGTAVSDFFKQIAEAGPKAGISFSSLGSALQAILPLLGRILAVISDFASGAFPILATAIGFVATALGSLLDFIRPVAPALGATAAAALVLWAAFKGVTIATAAITAFTAATARIGASAGAAIGGWGITAARATSIVTGLGNALPIVGIAVIALASAFGNAIGETDDWAKSLSRGETSLESVRQQLLNRSAFEILVQQGFGAADAADAVAGGLDIVMKKMDGMIQSAGPLQASQLRLQKAQLLYDDALRAGGPGTDAAVAAQGNLSKASEEVARATEDARRGTEDYGNALTGLVTILDGMLNKSLAFRDALQQQAELTTKAADAVKQHGANSKEASDAIQALGDQYLRTAQAAAAKAGADNGGAQSVDGAKAASQAYIVTLSQLLNTQNGPGKAAALGFLKGLNDTELGAITAAAATSGLRTRVLELPDHRMVTIVLDDQATPGLIGIREEIRSIQGKTVTIFVNEQGAKGGMASAGRLAMGGPAKAGRTYLVGEQGPELLTMTGDGFVTPNDKLTSALGNSAVFNKDAAVPGGDTIVNVYIDGQEFRGMIRSEVSSNERNTRRTVSAGAGAAVA